MEVSEAADRLEKRASIARQILADIEAINHPISLNDDDWYVFDESTNQLIAEYGSKWLRFDIEKTLEPGQRVSRGLSLKMRDVELWRSA